MKALVVGYGKAFDYNDVVKAIKETRWNIDSIQILSRGARGTDLSVKRFTENHDIPLKKYDDGDTAGSSVFRIIIRRAILECDGVIAFWDGSSDKTEDVVETARKCGKFIYIYEKEDYDENNL